MAYLLGYVRSLLMGRYCVEVDDRCLELEDICMKTEINCSRLFMSMLLLGGLDGDTTG